MILEVCVNLTLALGLRWHERTKELVSRRTWLSRVGGRPGVKVTTGAKNPAIVRIGWVWVALG